MYNGNINRSIRLDDILTLTIELRERKLLDCYRGQEIRPTTAQTTPF